MMGITYRGQRVFYRSFRLMKRFVDTSQKVFRIYPLYARPDEEFKRLFGPFEGTDDDIEVFIGQLVDGGYPIVLKGSTGGGEKRREKVFNSTTGEWSYPTQNKE